LAGIKRKRAIDAALDDAGALMPIIPLSQLAKEGDQRIALGDRTRQRIMRVAEILFAQKGYDAVSLRDIVSAANVNSAAIYYHFKSKEGLLFSILKLRGASIAAGRMKNLAKLKRQDSFTLADVLRAFLRPAIYDDRNGLSIRSHYADIRTRMSTERLATVRSIQAEVFDESTHAFLAVLHELLPHVSAHDMYFRLDFLLGLMLHAMSNNGRITDLSQGDVDSTDPEEVMRHLIPFLEAGFRSRVEDAR
jgi:AcrR family transcriptional regulator